MDPETNDKKPAVEVSTQGFPELKIHQHDWSKWWPYDRKTLHRVCNISYCKKVQYKDVSSV